MSTQEQMNGWGPQSEQPAPTPLTPAQIDAATKRLEKQHKLSKLSCEISEFRYREVRANMEYLALVQAYNQAQSPVAPTASAMGNNTQPEGTGNAVPTSGLSSITAGPSLVTTTTDNKTGVLVETGPNPGTTAAEAPVIKMS